MQASENSPGDLAPCAVLASDLCTLVQSLWSDVQTAIMEYSTVISFFALVSEAWVPQLLCLADLVWASPNLSKATFLPASSLPGGLPRSHPEGKFSKFWDDSEATEALELLRGSAGRTDGASGRVKESGVMPSPELTLLSDAIAVSWVESSQLEGLKVPTEVCRYVRLPESKLQSLRVIVPDSQL